MKKAALFGQPLSFISSVFKLDIKFDALSKRHFLSIIDGCCLLAHVCFPASEPDSLPPPVSFSPPNAPPISAPEVPTFTLAIPQSEPEFERNVSASCRLLVKMEEESP